MASRTMPQRNSTHKTNACIVPLLPKIVHIKPSACLPHCKTYRNKICQFVKTYKNKMCHCYAPVTANRVSLRREMETYSISNVTSAYRATCTPGSSRSYCLKTCNTNSVHMELWHCHRQPLDKRGRSSTVEKTETMRPRVVT